MRQILILTYGLAVVYYVFPGCTHVFRLSNTSGYKIFEEWGRGGASPDFATNIGTAKKVRKFKMLQIFKIAEELRRIIRVKKETNKVWTESQTHQLRLKTTLSDRSRRLLAHRVRLWLYQRISGPSPPPITSGEGVSLYAVWSGRLRGPMTRRKGPDIRWWDEFLVS